MVHQHWRHMGIIEDIENSCSLPNQNNDIFFEFLWHLDILPRSWDVPTRQASLAGRRPQRPDQLAWSHQQRQKLLTKPGLRLTPWHPPAASMVSIYWISMDLSQGVQDAQEVCGCNCQRVRLNFGGEHPGILTIILLSEL